MTVFHTQTFLSGVGRGGEILLFFKTLYMHVKPFFLGERGGGEGGEGGGGGGARKWVLIGL